MRSILILGLFTAVTALFPPQPKEIILQNGKDTDLTSEWLMFKRYYARSYDKEEDTLRRSIYLNTRIWIDNHNQKYLKGEETYKASLNQFSDRTLEEATQGTNGYQEEAGSGSGTDGNSESDNDNMLHQTESGDLPETVDYRTIDDVALTIKDQTLCGACWAFSATGSIEAMCTKLTGQKYSLSEQELVDCSRPEKNKGCNGGQMTKAFDYIIKHKGLTDSTSYPYTAKDDKCGSSSEKVATISGYKRLDNVKEPALMGAIANIGPVCAGIDASLASMFTYSEGIYKDKECNSTSVNHGVLIVGYGTSEETGEPYWIIKNSWGESWGDKGYMLMSRGKNACGILNMLSYPIVTKEDCFL